jgi:polyisoprenoid-binding protein YceI
MTTIDLQRQEAPALERWHLEPDSASVEFAVKTFWGLSTVRGRFTRCSGSYEVGPHGPKIELAVDAGSIDTGNRRRDTHLRSADFFAVADHPEVRFVSTHVHDTGDGTLYGTGRIAAAGETAPLAFAATVRPFGGELEIDATASIDHRWLGMSSGPLRMIRPPATINVRARLTR